MPSVFNNGDHVRSELGHAQQITTRSMTKLHCVDGARGTDNV
jgi:hypothetical protein